jgi:hypothetical protein
VVLVGNEYDRSLFYTGCKHTSVHGVAHHAIEVMFLDESVDTHYRFYHIKQDPFRAPECLFQAEKAILPFKTDFAMRPVKVADLVLLHEII